MWSGYDRNRMDGRENMEEGLVRFEKLCRKEKEDVVFMMIFGYDN